MGDIFFPLKVRKDGLLEDAIINAKKIGGLETGFKKMVCSKNGQEHKESKLRNLGKWFSREEMVKWGRKCK